jgi:TRAP-type C4-dicarboxylate transport system permease small subunit
VTGGLAALIERAALTVAAATLALALVAMGVQVVSRYVLGDSIIWAEELARYALIWSAMVGAAVAYRRGAHIGVTALLDALPPAARTVVARGVHLVCLAFALLVAWQGWALALRNFDRGQTSPALQIDIAWANLAVAAGALLLALAAAEALWRGQMPSSPE